MRSIVKGGMLAASAVALAAALAAAVAVPASADPPAPRPLATDLAAVGSDTIEYVVNDLADINRPPAPPAPAYVGYNNQSPAPSQLLDSWNATGSATIVPKPGCASINRPNGSQAGIDALKADSGSCIDLARSSRAPKPASTVPPVYDGDQTAAGPLMFVPFAEDEVRYALSAGVVSHGVNNLSAANLKDIYTCTITNWSQLGGAPGIIAPKIPQAGSGTRSFFLSQIQLGAPNMACVTEVQEHDPSQIENNPDAIGPFSKARSLYPTNLTGRIVLNTTGFVGYRPVYLVSRNGGGNTIPNYLQPLLGDGTPTGILGWICTTPGQDIVALHGFGPLPGHTSSNCGVAEHI